MNSDSREIICDRFVSWDSEFDAKKDMGEPPGPPVCICAVEINSDGRVIEHRLKYPYPKIPPWNHGPSDPFLGIVYSGGAEAGSSIHVSWPFPFLTVDLYAEYLVIHNSEMVKASGEDSKPPGPSLIKACRRYGVEVMDEDHKDEMRRLVYEKTDHTPEEIAGIQDYCIEDCWAGIRLFKVMQPRIDFLRAPIRGAFMMEIARMHWHGIPIDTSTYYQVERCGAAIGGTARGVEPETDKRSRENARADGRG